VARALLLGWHVGDAVSKGNPIGALLEAVIAFLEKDNSCEIVEILFLERVESPCGTARGPGLAAIYGVVEQKGGTLSVDRVPGKGTTIRIHLPRQDGAAESSPEIEVVATARGGDRILLVDDDAMVRRLVRETLRSRGYEVLDAESGEKALRRILEEGRAVDLLLTDLAMPDMGGRELARHVQARWPGLPVLYMSGYSEEMILSQGKLDPPGAFLPKPFSIEELLLKVRTAILSRAPE
jgi:CheY-like chemotaxis protein